VFGFGMCKSWGTVHGNNAKPRLARRQLARRRKGFGLASEIGVDLLTRSRPSPADDGARLPAISRGELQADVGH
jgi:hypothetical protein